ncbi:hypothetical protein AAG747_28890, partial [Rapidithrix thailandica]
MKKYILLILSLFSYISVFSQSDDKGILIKEVLNKAREISDSKNYTDQKMIYAGRYTAFDFLKIQPTGKIPQASIPKEYFEVYKDKKNRITKVKQYNQHYHFLNNDFYFHYSEGVTFM